MVWLLLLSWASGHGQVKESVSFQEKVHDFGEVIEAAGPVEFEFVFTNLGNRPVKVLSVQASCGCTTPGWSKELVEVGKTGFVKASFDPKGRPGYFNKSLTVTTDADKTPIVLQIKGSVVDKLSSIENMAVANGNLRLKNSSFNLGKLYINKPVEVKEFILLNAGKTDIKVTKIQSPEYLTVAVSEILKAGEQVALKLTLNAKARNQYGFVTDHIELTTDDTLDPIKSFSVYATLEDFFPKQSPEELAKAPALIAQTYLVDFARVKQGTKVSNTIGVTNKGKQNLEVRYIQSNCTCLVVTTPQKVVKPGESIQLTWTLDTASRLGTQNKAITIYSNDPANPVQRITFSGFITD